MTTEERKAALDAILERIHLEGYEDFDDFSKSAAIWFAEESSSTISRDGFVKEFKDETAFFRFNQISDRERFLQTMYDDAIDAIDQSPTSSPDQIYVEEIDSFQEVSIINAEDLDVDLPLEMYEEDVKDNLREIIGEPFDQDDWGGERNDLFTNRVLVDGERVETAVMLKGPSVSSEMHMSDAGSRGDQVQRLFESPANLFIVQYNGKFEDRFIQHVRQQAQIENADMYCLMDGIDTARVLRAYGKI